MIVAVRYASSVAVVELARAGALARAGSRASRSKAQASCEAVVSCRRRARHELVAQLLRRGHRLAVLVARARAASRACRRRSPRRSRGAPRSARRSARRRARDRVRSARRASGLSSRCGGGISESGLSPKASTSVSRLAQLRRAGRPRSSPKTARRMISSVSRLQARVQRDRLARAATRRPRARRARSSARTGAASARRGRPAACSLRCARCGASSSRITELRPDDRLEDARALAGVQRPRADAVKICLISLGVGDASRTAAGTGRRTVKRFAVARAAALDEGGPDDSTSRSPAARSACAVRGAADCSW